MVEEEADGEHDVRPPGYGVARRARELGLRPGGRRRLAELQARRHAALPARRDRQLDRRASGARTLREAGGEGSPQRRADCAPARNTAEAVRVAVAHVETYRLRNGSRRYRARWLGADGSSHS